MTRGRIVWWLILILMLGAVSVLEEQRKEGGKAAGLRALERMVEVKGYINISNYQGSGRRPFTGAIVVFQRVRDDQSVAVRVNSDGYYEVFLERGHYRVIVPKMKTDETGQFEMLAVSQEKYIDIGENNLRVQFDIEISPDDL